MNSFKWGIIAAICAFVISVLVGIISGVGVFFIFIRAVIFTVVFFGVGFGIRFIINSFFPELLFPDEGSGDDAYGQDEYSQPGSRINITMDNTGEYAVPELFRSQNNEEMGNIDDLISGAFVSAARQSYRGEASSKGIDDNAEEGYNRAGVSLDAPDDLPFMGSGYSGSSDMDDVPEEKSVFTPSFGDDAGLGGLPDLDMMARAFSPGSGPSAPPSAASSAFMPAMESVPAFMSEEPIESAPSRSKKGNKPEPLKGDFNPKELAEGIRSVLSNDK